MSCTFSNSHKDMQIAVLRSLSRIVLTLRPGGLQSFQLTSRMAGSRRGSIASGQTRTHQIGRSPSPQEPIDGREHHQQSRTGRAVGKTGRHN